MSYILPYGLVGATIGGTLTYATDRPIYLVICTSFGVAGGMIRNNNVKNKTDGNHLNSQIDNLSLYRHPLETVDIKRCSKCLEYKDRKNDFSRENGISRTKCRKCFIRLKSEKILNLKRSSSENDLLKLQEIRKKAANKYRESRDYKYFMRQLEQQENQQC